MNFVIEKKYDSLVQETGVRRQNLYNDEFIKILSSGS
jgi:hypothetical protein